MKDIGKAIFNLQRFQILQTKVNPQTSDTIPDFYAYAWYVRLCPVLEEGELHDDLKDYFSITPKQVDIVTKWADDEWLAKRLYTFYQYEDHFLKSTPTEGLDRWNLICILRYSYLRKGFDKGFWDKLLEPMKYPTEAASITKPFDVNDIYIV
jgi:hypothetical protein